MPSLAAEYERYWANGSSLNDVSIVRLLLILALGSCFYQGADRSSLHSTAITWIMAAYNWTSAPNIKHHLTIPGIQIHCLLLLAMQTHSVGGDIVVVSATNLIGMAKQMGLDRDPSSICNMSPLQAEIRRRLWTTTLELLVQASIDCGQAPIVSPDDYDCPPPTNVNDIQLNDETNANIIPEPLESYTQASAAIILAESLPVRLRITKYLNHIRSDISYDSTLRLGTQLNQSLRTHFDKAKQHMPPFQLHLTTLLTHRFLLSLHLPFATKAAADPTRYLSRKIVADTSPLLLGRSASPPTPPSPFDPPTAALPACLAHASGFFRAAQLQAAAAVALELLAAPPAALAPSPAKPCAPASPTTCGGCGAAADVRAQVAGAGDAALGECVEALAAEAAAEGEGQREHAGGLETPVAVVGEGWTPDDGEEFGLLDFQFDPDFDAVVPGSGQMSGLFS
ncbi:hypothetical protein GTA08_BOTSDO08896 [Botryosphaeria dothidea]|uniref:Xylanolytic transcriptional activator regulatory domain-containing protein n=1 Tax=Botryosphaeria dothidea TaxID=55169 RepID=A0A8H4N0Z1_9PEZI|nr:hypothetical protein GTA08_BOTSDO08896 [Botryosphaeria dothidea]